MKLSALDVEQQTLEGQTMSRLRLYNELECATPDSVCLPGFTLLDRRFRTMISKLRCGTLPLAIETGRYRSIPRDQRLCRSCESGAVEDELHFIFDCIKYEDIRRNILNDIMPEESITDYKFCIKFMMNDINRSKKLATYLIEAFRKRQL